MGETLFTGGRHYSLVNNVRGDIIHGGTLFTPTPEQERKTSKNEQKSRDAAAKRADTRVVGISS